MNKDIILGYVKLYKDILEKHQIFLSEKDLSNIYQLILWVFELDDLYDVADRYPPNQERLERIKTSMISLMPDYHSIGLQEIAIVFQAMEEELLLKAKSSLNLNQYLKIARQSIGASIIMAYLASKINVKPTIWYSDIIVKFNHEITTLIRLANDYLDTDIDIKRSLQEKPQIKATHFFSNKYQLKRYLISRYIVHKLHYYFYYIRFQYLQLSSHCQDYLLAIACSESVLDWAFKVYVIDRNSCQ